MGVTTMFGLTYVFTPRQAAYFTITGSLVMVSFDLCRLRVRPLNHFFNWMFRLVLRESERDRIAGSTFMMVGVTLIVLFYPLPVARLTLLMFAVADPLASYVGIRFGREKLVGQKTLAGALAAFVACFALSLLFYFASGLVEERRFIVCLLSAWIGTGAELIPIGSLDDNLTFPLLAATGLGALLYVFGVFGGF